MLAQTVDADDNICYHQITKDNNERTHMGMIRVSDETEQRLKSISDGRSIGATVEMCLNALENMAADEEKKENSGAWARLATHIDEKFDELKALLEDTTVDRVAQSTGGGRAPGEKKYLDWDNFRYIVYELLKEGDEEWASKQSYLAIENLDDEIHVYEKNGSLWVDDYYGRPSCILNISPRVREAIDKNFTFDE